MQQIPYPAPSFNLPASDSKTYSLDGLKGSWVVLYVYPKDETPGCTIEACSFRDAYDEILKRRAVLLGLSMDDDKSHKAFESKHNLPFPLLSDTNGNVIKKYNAWGKKMFGKEGILRRTYIINPNGEVVKVYGKVTPLGHGQQVIDELDRLQR
jgi:peroxiredoxin Q/BCP